MDNTKGPVNICIYDISKAEFVEKRSAAIDSKLGSHFMCSPSF